MSEKTAKEKAAVLDDFANHCIGLGIKSADQITPQVAYEFLTAIYETRGGHAANKCRKNLLAAWNWALACLTIFQMEFHPSRRYGLSR